MQSNAILDRFDASPMTARFWIIFSLFCLGFALDFFDFFIVGFLISLIGPEWHLTYLQSSLILLSAGIGAIIGALFFGTLADSWGRKRTIILSMMTCAVCSVALSVSPQGDWVVFALLRFLIGLGIGGVAGVQVVMCVEMTPTRYRAFMGGLPIVAVSLGTLLASGAAAGLTAMIGWRGLALLGATPAIVAVLIAILSPESPRWLLTKGRIEDARRAVAILLRVPLTEIPAGGVLRESNPSGSLREVYQSPRRFWLTILIWVGSSTAAYGVNLWGPTIVAMLLTINASHAAVYFVYVSIAAIVGRIAFCFLPIWTGRRRAGAIAGFGAALLLVAAAIFRQSSINGNSAFIIFLTAAALFYEGLFTVISPYTAEIYPVRLAARGLGVGQAANGIGKIVGPLCLALIAGANALVTPQSTIDAVLPAFLFLAGCTLVVGICFAFFAPEVTAHSLQLDDDGMILAPLATPPAA